MNKMIMVSMAFALAVVTEAVCAETNTVSEAASSVSADKPKLTKEERLARSQLRRYQRTGGIVRKQNSAYGKVVFLNAQKSVAKDGMKGALDFIDRAVNPIWELKDVPSVKTANPAADIAAAGAKLGVVIVEDPDIPALVTAPEAGWSIVNVAALKADNPSAEVLASRTRKEILRGFGLIGGAAFMSIGPFVMSNNVAGVRDLDAISTEEIGLEALAAIERGLPAHGVTPWTVATYKNACQQGWAPPPTNDVQKAIWESVHRLPTKPITIEKK